MTERGSAARILVLNDYPIGVHAASWRSSTEPTEHLWGIPALERYGFQVRVSDPPVIDGARGRLVGALGAPERQVDALRRRDVDVIYAPQWSVVRGLALLRRARLLRTPIVGVVHPSYPRGPVGREAIRGVDVAITISAAIAREVDNLRRGRPAILLPWGPDLASPGYVSTGDQIVVSSGRTHRDVRTLVAAAAKLDVPIRIYGHDRREFEHLPTNVQVFGTVDRARSDVLFADLQRASVIAIPLQPVDSLLGLTELNFAMALGKPVIMTRNRYVDVDIEAVGMGIWVAPADVQGWVEALAKLAGDAKLRQTMGRAARDFAEREWNQERYGDGLVAAISTLVGR